MLLLTCLQNALMKGVPKNAEIAMLTTKHQVLYKINCGSSVILPLRFFAGLDRRSP
jgi:hypothetical protein